MNICNAGCANASLVMLPTGACEPEVRTRQIERLFFWLCSTSIPSPLTCLNFKALVEGDDVAFSSPLADATFEEPETAEIKVADCIPAIEKVVSRVFTANDKIAITIPAGSGGTPPANPFGDYDFWKDKQSHGFYLRFGFLYCDGTVEIPKDKNGVPLAGSFRVYRSFEDSGDEKFEIKAIRIAFKGDPLAFEHPDLDISGCSPAIPI